jgi:hypothetical protein
MVGRHYEVGVLRDMPLTANLGLQRPRVEESLRGSQSAFAQTLQGDRQLEIAFLVVLKTVASARLALF